MSGIKEDMGLWLEHGILWPEVMIDFKKHGCIEDGEFSGLWTHPSVPFSMYESGGLVVLNVNQEYEIGRIRGDKLGALLEFGFND